MSPFLRVFLPTLSFILHFPYQTFRSPNSLDADQRSHLASSELGLHSLHNTSKRVSGMDGLVSCDFTSFSTVFQSYQDDWRMIMKGSMQWNPRLRSKRFRLELGANTGPLDQ